LEFGEDALAIDGVDEAGQLFRHSRTTRARVSGS
jgi:hypothetical protein